MRMITKALAEHDQRKCHDEQDFGDLYCRFRMHTDKYICEKQYAAVLGFPKE